MQTGWKSLVADKKRRQAEAIPKDWLITPPPDSVTDVSNVPAECGKLSSHDLEITGSEVNVLLEKLASSEWSSVAVTTAFYKRAIIAHQLTNCLTEIFVDKALARAAELDEHLKTTGKVVGPLHGLPISLKDQITIKGLETTMGYASWIGLYAEKNAVLVDILIQCGAVPFVRTNIPQTLMWPETFNNVFGRTVNPYNRSLTSGGSSGGEGALVALRGSPLGVGSDVGGSVRIPSAFCGIYGIRPSYGRIPYAGCVNSLEGQDSVLSVLGPLSNTLVGIKTFMKAVIGQKPWFSDPLTVRKSWDEEAYKLVEHGGGKNLCFAILWDDGLIVPHPPILRGLKIAKTALEAAGHRVIDWKPLKHAELYTSIAQIWGAGAAQDYQATTASTGEPILSSMSNDPSLQSESTFRREAEGVSAYELWQIQKKKRDLRQEYLDHWEKTVEFTGTGRPVDAILSPVAPYTAPPHGMNKNVDYTMIWNVLDYPALSIPISKVDESIDIKATAREFHSDVDKANHELYEPSTFRNAPISLQIIARTLEEEALIAMAEIVDNAVRELS